MARLALLLLAVVLAAGCSPKEAYSQATERAFMRSCLAADGDDEELEDVCRCSYGRIVRTMDFEEYERLDAQLRNNPEALPSKIERIVAGCGVRDN